MPLNENTMLEDHLQCNHANIKLTLSEDDGLLIEKQSGTLLP